MLQMEIAYCVVLVKHLTTSSIFNFTIESDQDNIIWKQKYSNK